jgi:hypothetical protein
MRNEDIQYIENSLCVKLPESYKKAVLEAKMVASKTPSLLYDDAKKVISVNKRLRNKGIYGQPWKENHFVIGYDSDGGDYYFIDLNLDNGHVYLANKTKTWRYSPEDISNNESPYPSIDKYVKHMRILSDMVINREKNPQPEQTEEEKQKMIADFFADMNKQFPRNKQ